VELLFLPDGEAFKLPDAGNVRSTTSQQEKIAFVFGLDVKVK
jgi:hypothetical protein